MRKDWKETDGTVASVDYGGRSRDGTEYSVVGFSYKVYGEWYGGTFTTGDSYRKDDTITVLYDPRNPDRNNLVQREEILHWVIGALLCAGGLLLLYFVLH